VAHFLNFSTFFENSTAKKPSIFAILEKTQGLFGLKLKVGAAFI